MTLRECIDQVDIIKPNQYTQEQKVDWISAVEYSLYEDILKQHEIEDLGTFTQFTTDDLDKELVAPFPYDETYTDYIIMKIDEANQETARYNNSATMFNAQLQNYAKYINKNYKPKNKGGFRIY